MPIGLTEHAELCDSLGMITAKDILEKHFGGNASKAAKVTGISRASWSAWRAAGYPVALPPKVAAWYLSQQPDQRIPGPPAERVEASLPA